MGKHDRGDAYLYARRDSDTSFQHRLRQHQHPEKRGQALVDGNGSEMSGLATVDFMHAMILFGNKDSRFNDEAGVFAISSQIIFNSHQFFAYFSYGLKNQIQTSFTRFLFPTDILSHQTLRYAHAPGECRYIQFGVSHK